mgnify:CR=1 FL=1
MAFVFDYELLKESYEINLDVIERQEGELTEDDIEPKPTPAPATTQPTPQLFSEDEEEMPF